MDKTTRTSKRVRKPVNYTLQSQEEFEARLVEWSSRPPKRKREPATQRQIDSLAFQDKGKGIDTDGGDSVYDFDSDAGAPLPKRRRLVTPSHTAISNPSHTAISNPSTSQNIKSPPLPSPARPKRRQKLPVLFPKRSLDSEPKFNGLGGNARIPLASKDVDDDKDSEYEFNEEEEPEEELNVGEESEEEIEEGDEEEEDDDDLLDFRVHAVAKGERRQRAKTTNGNSTNKPKSRAKLAMEDGRSSNQSSWVVAKSAPSGASSVMRAHKFKEAYHYYQVLFSMLASSPEPPFPAQKTEKLVLHFEEKIMDRVNRFGGRIPENVNVRDFFSIFGDRLHIVLLTMERIENFDITLAEVVTNLHPKKAIGPRMSGAYVCLTEGPVELAEKTANIILKIPTPFRVYSANNILVICKNLPKDKIVLLPYAGWTDCLLHRNSSDSLNINKTRASLLAQKFHAEAKDMQKYCSIEYTDSEAYRHTVDPNTNSKVARIGLVKAEDIPLPYVPVTECFIAGMIGGIGLNGDLAIDEFTAYIPDRLLQMCTQIIKPGASRAVTLITKGSNVEAEEAEETEDGGSTINPLVRLKCIMGRMERTDVVEPLVVPMPSTPAKGYSGVTDFATNFSKRRVQGPQRRLTDLPDSAKVIGVGGSRAIIVLYDQYFIPGSAVPSSNTINIVPINSIDRILIPMCDMNNQKFALDPLPAAAARYSIALLLALGTVAASASPNSTAKEILEMAMQQEHVQTLMLRMAAFASRSVLGLMPTLTHRMERVYKEITQTELMPDVVEKGHSRAIEEISKEAWEVLKSVDFQSQLLSDWRTSCKRNIIRSLDASTLTLNDAVTLPAKSSLKGEVRVPAILPPIPNHPHWGSVSNGYIKLYLSQLPTTPTPVIFFLDVVDARVKCKHVTGEFYRGEKGYVEFTMVDAHCMVDAGYGQGFWERLTQDLDIRSMTPLEDKLVKHRISLRDASKSKKAVRNTVRNLILSVDFKEIEDYAAIGVPVLFDLNSLTNIKLSIWNPDGNDGQGVVERKCVNFVFNTNYGAECKEWVQKDRWNRTLAIGVDNGYWKIAFYQRDLQNRWKPAGKSEWKTRVGHGVEKSWCAVLERSNLFKNYMGESPSIDAVENSVDASLNAFFEDSADASLNLSDDSVDTSDDSIAAFFNASVDASFDVSDDPSFNLSN